MKVAWNKYKIEVTMRNGFALASGKIPNPGKYFYLRLAAAAVREINAMRDKDCLRFARKAVIRTGLALNINEQWEERQLFPKLQEIVNKYRTHFEGALVFDDP